MSYVIRIVGNYTSRAAGVIRSTITRTLVRLMPGRNIQVAVPTAKEDPLQALVIRAVRPLQGVSLLESDDAVADLVLQIKADTRQMRNTEAREAFTNNFDESCEGVEGRETFELLVRIPTDSDVPKPFKVRTPPVGNYNDVDRGEPPFTVKNQKTIDRNKIPPKDTPAENFNLSGGRVEVDIVL